MAPMLILQRMEWPLKLLRWLLVVPAAAGFARANLWMGSLGCIIRADRSELLGQLSDRKKPVRWLRLNHTDGSLISVNHRAKAGSGMRTLTNTTALAHTGVTNVNVGVLNVVPTSVSGFTPQTTPRTV